MAERIVDNMNSIHGVHPGFRAVHAKGLCCRGTFIATPQAAPLSIAPHLQGIEVPVTVRFSNGSGRPTRADGARDERGMAVKFHLPDGASTDIVSLTLPVFFVRTPEDFMAFLDAQQPDAETGKPDLERIKSFVDSHPETQMAIGFSMFSMAPASYAGCTFHGIHAFRWIAPEGAARFVRYRWIPDAGREDLDDEQTRALGKDYLRTDLEKRLADGPVTFQLHVQLAEDGDDPTDPTAPWPEERAVVHVGTLTLTEFAGTECEPMIFDPTRVIDGIECSDDKILHARSDAYGVSYTRRTASAS
jgi:catalase